MPADDTMRDEAAAPFRRWVIHVPDGKIGFTVERPDLGALVLVQMGPWGPHRRLFRRDLRPATPAEIDWATRPMLDSSKEGAVDGGA